MNDLAESQARSVLADLQGAEASARQLLAEILAGKDELVELALNGVDALVAQRVKETVAIMHEQVAAGAELHILRLVEEVEKLRDSLLGGIEVPPQG